MPRAKLTELGVARIKPPAEGRREVWDATLPGFGLRVTAAGARSWVVALRKPGAKHPARIKVGSPPAMGLAAARDKARALMRDPGALEPRRVDTVAAVVALFVERYQRPRNRSWGEVRRVLERELAPWAPRPIQSIARRDVVELLDATAGRAPYMANRLLAHLRKLFGWAVERGVLDASPVAGIRAPAREQSRDRVLSDAELVAVWRAAGEMGWPWSPFIRLLVLLGQRRDEVASMRWQDLDTERRLWTMPRAMTKADREHEVPLSDLALEVLADLPRMGELVFPANRAGSANPVSGFSKAKSRLDRLSGVTGWRFHDLRRTAASGMARLGHPPHVVAAVLNHSPGATQGITAVYNRHKYGDEKRAALDAWAREVERVATGATADVVALRA